MIVVALLLGVQAPARYAVEWPEVAANCELPGATIERTAGRRRTLTLFIPVRVRRTEGRVSCARLWAGERGMTLVEPPLQRNFALALIGCGMPRVVWAEAPATRAWRIGFPQRSNMIVQARASGALACLETWAADRGYRVRVVNAEYVDRTDLSGTVD